MSNGTVMEKDGREMPRETQARRPSEDGSTAVAVSKPSADRAGKRPRWLVIGIVAIVAAAAIVYGVRWYKFNAAHVSTDDAQVGGDIYQVSAQVSGYLTGVYPATNQFVRKGDLLATIDPREYQAALEQAQANLDSLKAAAQASGHQVSVTRQMAGSGVSQAAAAENAARANVAAADTKLETARAGVSAARAALNSAVAGEQASQHAVTAAAAQVTSARSEYQSALAGLDAAESNQKKVAADAHRYETLFHQGAIPAQQFDASEAALSAANSQVQQARQAVDEAAARISQAQAAEESSRSQALQAVSGIQQARVGVLQAQDQVAQNEAAIAQAQAQAGQAHAALQGAESAPAQISVTTSNASANMAKIAQAQAAVEQAKLQLGYTEIRAPADGYVSEKNAEPGQLVQPGQALMAVVPLSNTYVDANFKETQLSHLAPGQAAEVTVDAYPGKVFKGRVTSIASATGATFSLLPPENATGNFVKVVQRVPVRIRIDQSSDPNHLLRLGMSVNATVTVQ